MTPWERPEPAPVAGYPILAVGLQPESEDFLRQALAPGPTSRDLIVMPDLARAAPVPVPLAAGVVEVGSTGEPPPSHVAYIGGLDPGVPIFAIIRGPIPPILEEADPALPVVPIPLSEEGGRLFRRTLTLAEGRAGALARLRAAEAAAERRSERFRALTVATRVAVWDWDLSVGRIWRSEGFEVLFGYRSHEIEGAPGWWVERIHPEDRPRVLERVEAPLAGEDDHVHVSYRARARDGTYVRVLDSGVVLKGGHERPVRMIGTIRELVDPPVPNGDSVERVQETTAEPSAAETALERLSAIERVTDAALAYLPLEDLLQELLTRLRAALGADAALAHLLTEDGAALERRAWIGLGGEVPRSVQIPLGKGITGRIAASGKPMIVTDLRGSDFRSPSLSAQFTSLLGAPLIVEGKTIGVLSVLTRARRDFTPGNQSLIQIVADRVASVVDRAALAERVRVEHRRLEALSHRLVRLQEEERREIARELHDGAGQLLMALRLSLDSRQPDRDRSGALLQELSDQVLGISMNLRPPMLDDLGLLPALRWHLDRFTSQTGIAALLRHEGLDRRFRPEVELAAFRIVQEALTNVARHAGSDSASVEAVRRPGALWVQVADHGSGFDPDSVSPGVSAGLIGMRERANLLGGTLAVRSIPGGGTKITAELPIA